MKDPWHLIRALDVILSLNGDVLKDESLNKAKELAARGLSRYNTNSQTEGVKLCLSTCSKQCSKAQPLEKK